MRLREAKVGALVKVKDTLEVLERSEHASYVKRIGMIGNVVENLPNGGICVCFPKSWKKYYFWPCELELIRR